MSISASFESYKAIIRDAIRLPIPGIIKSYQSTQYDDFGNKQTVIIRSTEVVDENGETTWTETIVK